MSLRLGFESGAPFDLVLIDEKLQWTGGESLPERLQRDGTLSIVKRVMFGYSSQIRTDKQVPYYHRILLHPISQSELYNCLLELGCDSSATSVKPIKSNFPTFKAQVLIVEDNKINQVVAKGLLEKFGVEVDIADHGEHALEKLINKRYELIFMDCQMPVMDGYQATGHIRQLQEGLTATAVPIVALSANAMKGDEENCLKAGMDDYIAKPVSPAALEQALRRWLPPENELSRT